MHKHSVRADLVYNCDVLFLSYLTVDTKHDSFFSCCFAIDTRNSCVSEVSIIGIIIICIIVSILHVHLPFVATNDSDCVTHHTFGYVLHCEMCYSTENTSKLLYSVQSGVRSDNDWATANIPKLNDNKRPRTACIRSCLSNTAPHIYASDFSLQLDYYKLLLFGSTHNVPSYFQQIQNYSTRNITRIIK